MSIEKQINTLKKVNEVHRIVHRNNSIYTRDLVGSLIEKIRMLQKQKKFLQTKLREACNGTKNSDN
jgi:3-polyprenyl-4-hydroxybenzoate decarboxylase